MGGRDVSEKITNYSARVCKHRILPNYIYKRKAFKASLDELRISQIIGTKAISGSSLLTAQSL